MDQCYFPSCYHVHYCFNYHHSDNGYPSPISSNCGLIHASVNWLRYACHSSKEKSHLVLCSQVYHTDGADGQQLFNYFQIRLHIFQGSQACVCRWWRMILTACCHRAFHPGQKTQTGCSLPRLRPDRGPGATAKSTPWIQMLHTKKMQLLKFQYNRGSAWNLSFQEMS